MPLFGRHEELAQLRGVLDAARTGSGGCMVFAGEAGSGKSTLLRTVAAEAGDDFRVIEVAGVETETDLAWSGLMSILWPLKGLVADLPPAQAELLGRLLHGDNGPTRHDPLAIGVAVLHLLAAAAAGAPLLIVADDLQWLDWATGQILQFVTRRIREDPIVLVGALRPSDPLAREERHGPMASAPWPGTTALRGLEPGHVASLLGSHGRVAAPAVCRELAERTGGNPLALVEMAALLSESELAGRDPLPSVLPVGQLVRDRVASQLSTLPEPTRRAVLVLALDPTMEREQAIAVFEAAGLVERDVAPAFTSGLTTSALAGARLVHPLVRAAIVQLATEAERADALLGMATSYPAGEPKGLLLRAEACTSTDDVLAAELEALALRLVVTVDAARAVPVLREAARLSTTASTRVYRRRLAAEAALATGDVDTCAALMELARDDAPEGEESARLSIVASRLVWRMTGATADPASLAAQADEVHVQHPALAADLLIEASLVPMRFGRVMQALPYAERAVEVAARADRRAQLRAAAIRWANLIGAAQPGAVDAAMPVVEELLNLEGPIVAGPFLIETVGRALAFRHVFPELDGLLDRVINAARRNGDASALVMPLTCQALRHFFTHYPSCAAAATEAIELAERTAQPGLATAARVLLPSALAALRDDGDLDRHLERLSTIADPVVQFSRCTSRGFHELALGRPQAALDALRPLLDVPGVRDNVIAWEHDLVEAYALTGRVDEARAELELLKVNPWLAGVWRDGIVHRLEALLTDDLAEAERLVGEAVALLDGHPSLGAARCQLWWGERLRRKRRRSDARVQLEAARARFVAMGASAWLDRCDRELEALGGQSGSLPRSSDVLLTPRELQIARAIVSGLSHGEAGAQLFISARTIEAHLASVYRKLQVRNRAELAALAVSDPSLLNP